MVDVTLVLSLFGRDTLWMLVDRRLSYGDEIRSNDAIKLMSLDTPDGTGVLGYAGLGATAIGTQPSEWMSAVLRNRPDLTFEQSLAILDEAASRELPQHMFALTGCDTHTVVCPAFIRGLGSRLFLIESHARVGSVSRARLTTVLSPRIAKAGTGADYLANPSQDFLDKFGARWERDLEALAKANDLGRVSDTVVADRMAAISCATSRAMEARRDITVGPRSIVVWRRRPEVGGVRGGGGHALYDGERWEGAPLLPSISHGRDDLAFISAISPTMMEGLNAMMSGISDSEEARQERHARMDAAIAQLPDSPDDTLR